MLALLKLLFGIVIVIRILMRVARRRRRRTSTCHSFVSARVDSCAVRLRESLIRAHRWCACDISMT
jgi:hypothetical protein